MPDVVAPRLPSRAASVEAFVPRGWAIETRLDGPVDNDARPDVVLLLRDRDPKNIVRNAGLGVDRLDTNPRLLVVLAAEAGGYRRLAQSDQVIRRNTNPVLSDPLEEGGLSLERRVLSVTSGFFSSAGSWSMGSTTHKFRWQDGCMRLIGIDERDIQRNTGATTDVSVNLLTGKVIRKSGSIENDRTNVHRGTFKRRARLCFEDARDGDFPDVPST
ncbi:hypothetical protein [Cognatilysobacter segetis]|uniref:hypothetical protein n=1 Tax=Cognatilysobacter segetis TaxID=2492394 RepID=UPI00105C9E21|nr:hypothetical protein [Lysobacter segetis]